MSRFRRIDAGTWADERFVALSDDGKLLWFYLLTGLEVTNLPGILVAGRAQLAEALGWELERLVAAFDEIAAQKDADGVAMAVADWTRRIVWLPKGVRHNAPANPNVVAGWRDAWRAVPECPLKWTAHAAMKRFVEPLGEGFREAFAKCLPDQSGSRIKAAETVSPTIPITVSETVLETIPRARLTAPAPDPAPESGERSGVTPIKSGVTTVAVAEEYEAAARAVLGGFALQRFADRELIPAVNGHAPSGLSGSELRARVRASVTAYITETRGDAKFQGGWQPKGWLTWLNSPPNGETLSRSAREPAAPPRVRPITKATVSPEQAAKDFAAYEAAMAGIKGDARA